MNGMLNSGADEQVQEYIDLLYNQSLLLEGSKIKDRVAFARSVAKLMTESAKGWDAENFLGHLRISSLHLAL
jgi:HSP90 family molecular chaperone